MVVDEVYFFDSYALIALFRLHPNYIPYREARVVTTLLNVIEVHYILLRDHGEAFATAVFNALLPATVDYEFIIQDANRMRLKLKKRHVSTTDCIGYALAQKKGVTFLTGDKEFEQMPNVAFVK